MTRKTSKKKRSKRTTPKTGIDLPPIDRQAREKMMTDIGRLLSEHEFASLEEANAFLQETLASGGLPPSSPQTPLEEAQDLMYEAWESTGRRRQELARRALTISPDCADAYVLLAEETAQSPQEMKTLYEQGVQAGERALGSEAFEEAAGDFWGILETRPYMRARTGLAQCLWMLGERQEAIAHYTDLLRLNPNDNQGIRYILAVCLLQEGADEALGKLLEQYQDDAAAAWLYNRALWLFRRDGASERANACLTEALDGNRFVPPYLLGTKKLPRSLPQYVGIGDNNEAVDYAAAAIPVWQKTAGALEWLNSNLPKRETTRRNR